MHESAIGGRSRVPFERIVGFGDRDIRLAAGSQI